MCIHLASSFCMDSRLRIKNKINPTQRFGHTESNESGTTFWKPRPPGQISKQRRWCAIRYQKTDGSLPGTRPDLQNWYWFQFLTLLRICLPLPPPLHFSCFFGQPKDSVPATVKPPLLINEFTKRVLSSAKEHKSLQRGFSLVLAHVNNEAASGGRL